MITEAQRKKIEYNDRVVRDYNRNKAIKISLEEQYREKMKRINKKLKLEADKRISEKPRTIMLHDRTIILEKDLTEEMIDREIEYWFTNHK